MFIGHFLSLLLTCYATSTTAYTAICITGAGCSGYGAGLTTSASCFNCPASSPRAWNVTISSPSQFACTFNPDGCGGGCIKQWFINSKRCKTGSQYSIELFTKGIAGGCHPVSSCQRGLPGDSEITALFSQAGAILEQLDMNQMIAFIQGLPPITQSDGSVRFIRSDGSYVVAYRTPAE